MTHRPRVVLFGGFAVCAALVGVLVALALSSVGPPGRPRGAPDAVIDDGQRLPYMGRLSWDDAVLLDARHIRIQISGSLPSSKHACFARDVRVVVVEASAVTITAAGYAPYERHVSGCPLNDVIIDRTIELKAPLGERELIDGSTGAQRPLQP